MQWDIFAQKRVSALRFGDPRQVAAELSVDENAPSHSSSREMNANWEFREGCGPTGPYQTSCNVWMQGDPLGMRFCTRLARSLELLAEDSRPSHYRGVH